MLGHLRVLALCIAILPLGGWAAGPVVNINTADAATLEEVKGIGPAKARAIVEHRRLHGPFLAVDDLVRVPGIGDKTLVKLRDQVSVSAPARYPADQPR